MAAVISAVAATVVIVVMGDGMDGPQPLAAAYKCDSNVILGPVPRFAERVDLKWAFGCVPFSETKKHFQWQ